MKNGKNIFICLMVIVGFAACGGPNDGTATETTGTTTGTSTGSTTSTNNVTNSYSASMLLVGILNKKSRFNNETVFEYLPRSGVFGSKMLLMHNVKVLHGFYPVILITMLKSV